MFVRISLVLVALVAVVAVPFVLRPAAGERLTAGLDADRLVLVSPHNEAIRHEFTVAFRRHYRASTGREVVLDWRIPGGTSEIARFLSSEFNAAFRSHWVNKLGREWSSEVSRGFAQPSGELPSDPRRGHARAGRPPHLSRLECRYRHRLVLRGRCL